jgi:hypothetical protein
MECTSCGYYDSYGAESCSRCGQALMPTQRQAQMQMQLQAFARGQDNEFGTSIGGPVPYRVIEPDNKLIISSPTIDVRARLFRNRLPSHVTLDDDFGVLQTIFDNRCSATYVFLPGLTEHATSMSELTRRAELSAERRTATRSRSASVDSPRVPLPKKAKAPVPYCAYSYRLNGTPRCDRGQHSHFYGNPASFRRSGALQALLGRPGEAVADELGLSDMDKPQHVFPLRSPKSIDAAFGVIDAYRYELHACWWFVAMRGPLVIHYFKHVEWKLRYRGDVTRDGLAIRDVEHDGGIEILSQGVGKGSLNPVIGGIAAGDAGGRVEWSTPFTDPLGLC